MSSSHGRRNYESKEDSVHDEQLLQERLQILLQRLGWSYAALWTFNHLSRVLEWKRGHFQLDTAAGTKVWYVQQLCTTYRSCSFVPGAGFVGRAYVEGQHIWLSGDSVCLNAGSLQQSQFLRDAHIKTVMCIPWQDSILELGTTNLEVGEEFELMDRIQRVMSHDLLSVLPDADAEISGFVGGHTNSESPASSVLFNPGSDLAAMSTAAPVNRPSFQSVFDSLSDRVWRSDLFIQEQGNNEEQPGNINIAAAWMKGGSGSRLQKNISMADQSTSHGLIMGSHEAEATQYGSFATTTSSSNGSSQGDNNHTNNHINININTSPARPAAAGTPGHLHQQYSLPIHAPLSVPDRTSSSSVREAHGQAHLQLQEPSEFAYPKSSITSIHAAGGSKAALTHHQSGLRRTTSCNDQYEIQKALKLFEAQSDQWQPGEVLKNPAASSHLQPHDRLIFPFPGSEWQRQADVEKNANVLPCQSDDLMGGNVNSSNQGPRMPQLLLRRHTLSAMEVLKEVDTFHEDQAAAAAADSNVSFEFPEDFKFSDQPARLEINASRSRGRSRMSTSHGSGVLHSSHSDAAVNHMLAERRRRVKQKENFATLRRLVPIISKGDKASTLVDAIAYLKDLQNTIVHMEAKEEDMDLRCESLAHKCMELEEQNKELVAILSRGNQVGQIDQLKQLQSMKSI